MKEYKGLAYSDDFKICLKIIRNDLRKIELHPETIQVNNLSSSSALSNLEEVIFNEKLEIINPDAFAMSNIKILDFSRTSLKYIEDYAFEKCKMLEKVYFPSTLIALGHGVFERCKSLKELDFSHTNLARIGDYCFRKSNLENICLPPTLALIGSGIFFETLLKEIDLSNTSLKTLESDTFSFCSFLEKVILPDTLLEIKSYAFNQCFKLEKISLPKNIKILGHAIFQDTQIKSLYLPSSIKEMGNIFRYANFTEISYNTLDKKVEDTLLELANEYNIIIFKKDLKSLLDEGKSFKQINNVYTHIESKEI